MSSGKLSLIIVAFCLFPGLMQGQEIIPGTGPFHVDLDIARFYGNESQIYVEVYYGIQEHIITYIKSEEQWEGGVKMKLKIWRDTTLVSWKDWSVSHSLSDTSVLAKGKTLVGLEVIGIPSGEYRLALISQDTINSRRFDSVSVTLAISSFPSNQEAFSDIELCTAVSPSTDTTGTFYKNTLDVVPNARSMYGLSLSSLYYYVELYNLLNSGNTEDFILRSTIIDGTGKEVSRQLKNKKRINNSVVEYGVFDISKLIGGSYHLVLTMVDTLEHIYSTASKKFFIYKPGSITPGQNESYSSTGNAAASEYALMTQQEVDSEFTISRYTATGAEQNEYNGLNDLDAKRKFLFDFWQRRNPDPSNPKNSYKIEYIRRVEYANLHFSKGLRKGWKTDQGRIYITYGPYDEIEEHWGTADTYPYDIWFYNNIQGGVKFIFVDRNLLNQFTLVHSTHRYELQNYEWFEQYVQKSKVPVK